MACCFLAAYCVAQLIKARHFLDLDDGITYHDHKDLDTFPESLAGISTTREFTSGKSTPMALILSLGGLTCSACTITVEDALLRLPGVDQVRISLPFQQATIISNNGGLSQDLILDTVRNTGYDAHLGPRPPKQMIELLQAKEEITNLRSNFLQLGRCVLLLQLMTWLASVMVKSSLTAQGLLWILSLFSLAMALYVQYFNVLWIHADAWARLRSGHVNMNTLSSLSMGLGSLCAISELMLNNAGKSNEYCLTTTGLALVVVAGRYLDALSRRSASKRFMETYKPLLETQYAVLSPSNQIVPSTYLRPCDRIVVEPFSAIPCDCYILEGTSLVNQSMITGESLPVRKTVGDCLLGGTRNQNARLVCAVQKAKEDSFFAQLVQLATDSTSASSREHEFVDVALRHFVTCVLVLSFAIPTFRAYRVWDTEPFTETFHSFISRMITILMSACPCALGLAIPSAVVALVSAAGKKGILISGGFQTIRHLQRSRTIVFDKTGTLTEATLTVENFTPAHQWTDHQEALWHYICAVEERAIASHPVARAIFSSGIQALGRSWLEKQSERKCSNPTTDMGLGVSGSVSLDGESWRHIMIGSSRYLRQAGITNVPEKVHASVGSVIAVHVSVDGKYAGTLRLGDTVKEEASRVIQNLTSMGYQCGMLTGDTYEAALKVSQILNLPILGTQAVPADKQDRIRSLQRRGIVTMVGDGLNDAPSLSIADVGIGLHRDSALATMGASIVILNSRLESVCLLYQMANLTMQQIRFNLRCNMAYNTVALVLASGLLQPFGFDLTPLRAAVIMSMSSMFMTWESFKLQARLER